MWGLVELVAVVARAGSGGPWSRVVAGLWGSPGRAGWGSGGRADWVAVVSVRRSAEGGGRWGLGWRDVVAHGLGCDACGVLSRHAAICVVTGALVIAEGALAGLLGSESVPRIAGVAGKGRVSFGGFALGG